MATVIYRCPVGAPGECPTSAGRGYCPVHVFQQLERYDPAEEAVVTAAPGRAAGGAAGPAAGRDGPREAEAATRPVRSGRQSPGPGPAARPVVRLALVIGGALLPVRGEHLRGGGGLAIGRDEPDCAAIPGLAGLDQLSRHHARLRWIDGVLYVEDAGSTNGTFVEDRRVAGPTRVGPGDRLRFAEDIDVQVIEIDEFGAPR